MLATIITVFTSGFIAAGVINEVVLPAGEYTVEKGTELYQEYVVETD